MRRNSKSKKAQGSLEYLVILASVLAVSAIVVLFMSGTFGTTGADVSGCKSAAGSCAAKLVTTYSPPCPACDTACVDSSGKDMMSKTTGCGGACTLCKLGEPMRISSSGWQPHELEPDSNTAGLWHFNEGGGTTLSDASPNGNTGSINGSTWSSGGKFGSALSFDGAGDYCNITNSGSLNISNAITIELWVFPTAIITGYAGQSVDKWSGTGDANYAIYHFGTASSGRDGELMVYGNAGGSWQSLSPGYVLPLNKWTHVAWTYTSTGGGFLYINGTAINTVGSGSGALATNYAPLRFGRSAGDPGFVGKIDEIAISNRAKTAAEIWVDANA